MRVAPAPACERTRTALAVLAAADPMFARCQAEAGPVLRPLSRPPGFPTLLRIILEQQVSTQAAATLWQRLNAHLAEVTPAAFLSLDDDTLRACGFSRQKARYGRGLAQDILAGRLDLDAVHRMPDADAVAALTRVTGIGRWSAEIYLLAALDRPDIWPADDLALALGVQWLKGLPARPRRSELDRLAEPWRPHRSTAARLI